MTKEASLKLQSFCVIRHKKRLRRGGDQVLIKGARDGECIHRRCSNRKNMFTL
jgi:coenzyme F420-reducing hydrogenase delta subunit